MLKSKLDPMPRHFILAGNKGTGKKNLANCLARILADWNKHKGRFETYSAAELDVLVRGHGQEVQNRLGEQHKGCIIANVDSAKDMEQFGRVLLTKAETTSVVITCSPEGRKTLASQQDRFGGGNWSSFMIADFSDDELYDMLRIELGNKKRAEEKILKEAAKQLGRLRGTPEYANYQDVRKLVRRASYNADANGRDNIVSEDLVDPDQERSRD
eukprot:2137823-Prymnesium_polylepis.1